MTERTIMASLFKAQCLALLDTVERSGVSFVVTKRGRPVARLVPLDESIGTRSTDRSVRLLEPDDGAYFSTGERWHVESPEA
jgi:prevent-host-death family protein